MSLAEGPDPTMSLAVMADRGTDDEGLRAGAEWWCAAMQTSRANRSGALIPIGTHVNLQLQASGRKSFFSKLIHRLRWDFGQHTAEEFDLKVIKAESDEEIPFVVDRTWVVNMSMMMKWVLSQSSVMVNSTRNFSTVGSVSSYATRVSTFSG